MEWWLGVAVVGVASVLLLWRWGTPLAAWWLVYWHGQGEPHQYQFYRCKGCRRIVTHRHIKTGGCPCHESIRIQPAQLRTMEKARLLLLPWTV